MTQIEAIAERAARALFKQGKLIRSLREARDINFSDSAEIIAKELAPLAKCVEAAESMLATKPSSMDRITAMNNLRQALSALNKEEGIKPLSKTSSPGPDVRFYKAKPRRKP